MRRSRLNDQAVRRRRTSHRRSSVRPDITMLERRTLLSAGSSGSGLNLSDDVVRTSHSEPALFLPDQLLCNDEIVGAPPQIHSVAHPQGGNVELVDGLVIFTPSESNGHDGGSDHSGHNDGHGDSHSAASFMYAIMGADGSLAMATVTVEIAEMVHGPGDETRAAEHMALFELVERPEATAISVQDGPWSDPSTWYAGQVPTEGDRVLIHATTAVSYDVQSDTPLGWLRVDGTLAFRPDADTRMVVETIAIETEGTLTLGTESAPIAPNRVAEILIDTTGGPLDPSNDPTLVGRGFISHGTTTIVGATKAHMTSLIGDARAGDAFIDLVGTVPDGWRIGDTLLLVGTHTDTSLEPDQYDEADRNNVRFHDELLRVTEFGSIGDATRIRFENVTNAEAILEGRTTLLWDHVRPNGATFDASELTIHVANLTRNVIVRSSDPDVPTQERGHFMIMHNVDAQVQHAQFRDLGRSDKRRVVDDPEAISNFDGTPGTGTNPRGHYGLHLHRLGADDINGPRAMILGNVVWGTPGWGIVHHDSHADLIENVVFDVVGAGIVAEEGHELGTWTRNLTVKMTGDLVNNFDDGAFFQTLRGPRFDLGFTGSGY